MIFIAVMCFDRKCICPLFLLTSPTTLSYPLWFRLFVIIIDICVAPFAVFISIWNMRLGQRMDVARPREGLFPFGFGKFRKYNVFIVHRLFSTETRMDEDMGEKVRFPLMTTWCAKQIMSMDDFNTALYSYIFIVFSFTPMSGNTQCHVRRIETAFSHSNCYIHISYSQQFILYIKCSISIDIFLIAIRPLCAMVRVIQCNG